MLSFKQYLEESLDKPYPIKFHSKNDEGYGSTVHEYHFQDHKGDHHPIYFRHYDETPHEAEMTFSSPEGGYEATGKQGHHAIKIFSTMKKAIERHAKKNPKLKKITFGSYKDQVDRYDYKEGSRNKLYRRMTKMFGGKTSDDTKELVHTIRVNKGEK